MMMNWTCPHCDRDQVVGATNYQREWVNIRVPNTRSPVGLNMIAIGCANTECKQLTLAVDVKPATQSVSNGVARYKEGFGSPYLTRRLIPEGYARPQPDYIPRALVEDYNEACAIRDLSPKAAATLARRCIQGMIRDFCRISKKTLDQEINALKAAVHDFSAPREVTLESVEGIDRVRSIGNIGAHMEKDVNLIVPIDPDEAGILIELIETLFDDWYVAKHVRQARFANLDRIAAEKKAIKEGATDIPPAATSQVLPGNDANEAEQNREADDANP